eukprot:937197_1
MTHPTIKSRNQKAQTEWNQIKLKHLTETQIKSKRLPSRRDCHHANQIEETEQITITELSMPANLRAKVQNWQLQPKLKQTICLPMISYDQTA